LPPNDDFANRLPIVGSTATVTGSNIGASNERNDSGPHNVWWKWTPPTTGFYTMTTLGSDFNLAIAIFTGDALGSLDRLVVNGYYTNNLARVTFLAAAGTEYQVMIFGENGETGHIQISVQPAVRPANDDFAQRTRLTARNELVTGTDFDAGYDPSEWRLELLKSYSARSGQLIWWEWVAPIDGAAEISVPNSVSIADGGKAPASILVFAGDTFPTDENAVQVADAPGAQGTTSLYLTEIHAGTHYQIGLDGVDYEHPIAYTLKIRAIAPPRIISGSAHIEAGVFKGRAEGIEGHNYRVKYSTDFKTWDLVSEHPAISGEFAFESPVEGAYRFYRIEEYELP
jgi:hypothetical protein